MLSTLTRPFIYIGSLISAMWQQFSVVLDLVKYALLLVYSFVMGLLICIFLLIVLSFVFFFIA